MGALDGIERTLKSNISDELISAVTLYLIKLNWNSRECFIGYLGILSINKS